MKPLALEPTVIVCLVCLLVQYILCACFAYDLSASQNEVPDTRSQSNMTATITHNSTTVSKKNYSHIDNNTEARTGPDVSLIRPMNEHLFDTGHFVGLEIPVGGKLSESPLRDVLKSETHDAELMLSKVETLLGKEDWRISLRDLDISWDDPVIRREIIAHCLKLGLSPQEFFYLIDVPLPKFLFGLKSINPKMIVWFEYIIQYRSLHAVYSFFAKEANTASPATLFHDPTTSHDKFDDEDLFKFLLGIYQPQPVSKSALTLAKPKSRQVDEVVKLFEFLRKDKDSHLKELAEEMLEFLLFGSETFTSVFRVWLSKYVSPMVLLRIVSPNGEHNKRIEFLWNRYVQLYVNHKGSTRRFYPLKYQDMLAFLKQKKTESK
ncbi:hypothetical protein Plhal304r1_c016g0058981 [Plasmopara halstedii]